MVHHPVAHAELLLLLPNSRKIERLNFPVWPLMHHLHAYPDLRAMFRRLLIAALIGVLAALAVAGFRHAMLLLEWLFLSNNTGGVWSTRRYFKTSAGACIIGACKLTGNLI